MCKVRDYFHPNEQKSLAGEPGRKSQLEAVASGIRQKEKCVGAGATVLFSDSPLPKSRHIVIWRREAVFVSIGSNGRNLRPRRKNLWPQAFFPEVLAMTVRCVAQEGFEISPRFRQTIEERIARLDRDANHDEAQMDLLNDIDHIRRQMRLVAVQRAEALRMRLFLDRARTRLPRPLIERVELRSGIGCR